MKGPKLELKLNFDAKKVQAWAKDNILLVVLGSASVLALAGGYFGADTMLSGVMEEAQSKASRMSELKDLERTTVTLDVPGQAPFSQNAIVNQKLLEAYSERVSALRKDGIEVRALAVERNRGNHAPIMSLRFPQAAPGETPEARESRERQNARALEQINLDFFQAVRAAYDRLIAQHRMGSVPDEEDVQAFVLRRKEQFIASDLKKGPSEPLSSQEQEALSRELGNARLQAYNEAARDFAMYADRETLRVPVSPFKKDVPDVLLPILWRQQWEYWVLSDVLAAFARVNGPEATVQSAAVKRIDSIRFVGPVGGPSQPAPAGSEGAPAEADPGMGGDQGMEGSMGMAAGGVGAPIDPSAPVPPANYASSFTGRRTNPLYDVFATDITFVCETSRIPQVFDALAQQNFITVTMASVRPEDPFEAAEEGYIYGPAHVSLVRLRLESVWFREWTGPLMPEPLLKKLGTSGMVVGTAPPGGGMPSDDGSASYGQGG